MILAPLRGVTIRAFREAFAGPIVEAGFTEAFTPFIAALPGLNPLKDRELQPPSPSPLPLTPQFIGKDPASLREALKRVRDAGYQTADLNCGCPFPMVRNKGRGSGLLRSPDTLQRMLEAGCETMGEGRFSVKARLGVERTDELLKLMPRLNGFPLRFLTVHARTARQMYTGACDHAAFSAVRAAAKMPVIYNGDAEPVAGPAGEHLMVGRAFLRSLGARDDFRPLFERYLAISLAELSGEHPVLGRMKELLAYFKDLPAWHRRWQVIKLARSLDELRLAMW